MDTIQEMMLRAQLLRQETALDSISPERAGGIMYDTLAYINQMQLQGANPLLISKIYASVAAMEADSAPVSDLTGQALRPGQVVVIASADSDNGSVYRYNGGTESRWTVVGKIGNLTPVDSLDSDSTQLPLAAHQGNVLNGKIADLSQKVGFYDIVKSFPLTAGVKIDSKTNLYNGETIPSGTIIRVRMDVNPANISGSIRIADQDWGNPGIAPITTFNEDLIFTLTKNVTSLGVYLPADNVVGNGELVVSMNLAYGESIKHEIDGIKGDVSELKGKISPLELEEELDYTPYISLPTQKKAERRLNRIFDMLVIEGLSQEEVAEINAFTANIARYNQNTGKYVNSIYLRTTGVGVKFGIFPETYYNTEADALAAIAPLIGKESTHSYTYKVGAGLRFVLSNEIFAYRGDDYPGSGTISVNYDVVTASFQANVSSHLASIESELFGGVLSDCEAFNLFVEQFECVEDFTSVYDRVQVRAGNLIDETYRVAFYFFHTGWDKSYSLLSDGAFSTRQEAFDVFRATLQGLEIKTDIFHIKFKDEFEFPENGVNVSPLVTYYNTNYSPQNEFLSELVLQQTRTDDILRKEVTEEYSGQEPIDIDKEMEGKTFQMLRSDQIVVNDNILLAPNNQLGVVGFEGKTSQIHRKYYTTHMLSSAAHTWDFSELENDIELACAEGKRSIPRLFTSASSSAGPSLTYTHLNSETGVVETNRIDFPVWIADLMAADANAQWYKTSPAEQSVSYWLLDFNVPEVRAAIIEGIEAFGNWLNSASVLNPAGESIPVKDAILYIEFNPLGSWGEGQFSPISFDCSVEDMVEIWDAFMQAAPDNIITTGIATNIYPIKMTALKDAVCLLSNNRGGYGFTIEHLGETVPLEIERAKKYRGRFFSGEGAAWYKSGYYQGSPYVATLRYLKELKFAYMRIQNWTIEDAALNPVKNYPDIAFKNKQILAFVGYRFVLSPMYCEWRDHNTFRTYLSILNIGSSKCWWDFYQAVVIVADSNGNILSSNNVSIDFQAIVPNIGDTLGEYNINSLTKFNTQIDVNLTGLSVDDFDVYLKVVDKVGIADPLYFSNYGRVKSGDLTGCYNISKFFTENGATKWKAGLFTKTSTRP